MKEAKMLGKNLKRIRKENGISQGDIARTLKVHKGYISNIENGKGNPTLATIAKIAKAANTTISELTK